MVCWVFGDVMCVMEVFDISIGSVFGYLMS